MQNYEIFTGEALKVADRIQKLRLCLLIHSCIYYELNYNLITDLQWDSWARELLKLQTEHPEISDKVDCYKEAFKDWDASTGAFLPVKDNWVIYKAQQLLYMGAGAYNPGRGNGKTNAIKEFAYFNDLDSKKSALRKRALF